MIEGAWRRDPFEVRQFPDDLSLRLPAHEITEYDDKRAPERQQTLRQLIVGMGTTMFAMNGSGLAAPQVGVCQRLMVVRDHDHKPNPPGAKAQKPIAVFAFINPRILEADGEEEMTEGCLSLPGLSVVVPRATRIVVEHESSFGDTLQVEAVGYEARVIQHETDHLDGKLITDYLSPHDRRLAFAEIARLEREMARRKHEQMQQMLSAMTLTPPDQQEAAYQSLAGVGPAMEMPRAEDYEMPVRPDS